MTFKYYVHGQSFEKIQVLIKNGLNTAAKSEILWSQDLLNQLVDIWITQTVPIQSSTDFKVWTYLKARNLVKVADIVAVSLWAVSLR